MEISRMRLFVVCHGQRMDDYFGDEWVNEIFDTNGALNRNNLNLPLNIYPRSKEDHLFDPPLTSLGHYQCRLLGQYFKSQGINFSAAFSSPALRCVQSITNILKANHQRELAIGIEPFLFDFFGCSSRVPQFLSMTELRNAVQTVVNDNYKACGTINQLERFRNENMPHYFQRNYNAITNMVNSLPSTNLNVLICGHKGTLAAATQELLGVDIRDYTDEIMFVLGKQVPDTGMTVISRELKPNATRLEEDWIVEPWNVIPAEMKRSNFNPLLQHQPLKVQMEMLKTKQKVSWRNI
ncbi:hypothetical protein SNEBB_011170 [Seison nebaliae]|nr:hypothetical protein SNEBB_011170 [Seison nebaliae]